MSDERNCDKRLHCFLAYKRLRSISMKKAARVDELTEQVRVLREALTECALQLRIECDREKTYEKCRELCGSCFKRVAMSMAEKSLLS